MSAFLLAALGPGALAAAGDDGPARTARPDRPTRTVLRPTEVPELAPVRPPVPSAKEAIVLVSGINSFPQDPTFDPLIKQLLGDPRYEIYRFGGDPTHPFDGLGDLDVNARNLTDEVRALGETHPAVHIVAHSMGGAIVDRALANGLSASDGLVTYVALAVPHSGSARLAAGGLVLDGLGDTSLEVRALLSPKLDPGSAAARGLAHARPARAAAGVTRLDLRTATDWTVTAADARDPGITSRTLLPSGIGGVVDGHGAVTRDPVALRLITSTIATRAIPPETRGWEVPAAALLSRLAGLAAWQLCLLGLVAACGVGLALRRTPVVRLVTRPLAIWQLRRVRLK